MATMTRRTLIGSAAATAALAPGARALGAASPARAIRPGQVWLDTAGKPIQAHGGSIIRVGDLFYWYGENKERTHPGSDVWQWGMRCYSSPDLTAWTDRGLFLPPDLANPKGSLAPSSLADRPHIVFNEATGKFVCWIKIMHPDASQTRTVFTADAITGPYRMVRDNLKPLGMNAGDFDLVVAPDGKAYMVFERVHTELIWADLTADYTDLTGYYSTHFPGKQPPFTREGPAYFTRNGRHYLFTSGTTGYHPNPTQVAMADTYYGPWTVLGDAHRGDPSLTSFNSQICSVFKHPTKRDLYIALADRWIYDLPELEGPDFATGVASRRFEGFYAKMFAPGGSTLTAADKRALAAVEGRIDTFKARYVWLPVRFDGERPYLQWTDRWSIGDYA